MSDQPNSMTGPEPLWTEFSIYHRLESQSCDLSLVFQSKDIHKLDGLEVNKSEMNCNLVKYFDYHYISELATFAIIIFFLRWPTTMYALHNNQKTLFRWQKRTCWQ